jgi:hypothetical protein
MAYWLGQWLIGGVLLAAVLQDLPWSSVLLQTPLLLLPHSNSKVVGVPEVIFREEIAVRVKRLSMPSR